MSRTPLKAAAVTGAAMVAILFGSAAAASADAPAAVRPTVTAAADHGYWHHHGWVRDHGRHWGRGPNCRWHHRGWHRGWHRGEGRGWHRGDHDGYRHGYGYHHRVLGQWW